MVEPRFRAGVQSTVGIDTVVGGYPAAQLACTNDTDAAPSRPPRNRLGYDTVLCGGTVARDLQLTPRNRIGTNSTLV